MANEDKLEITTDQTVYLTKRDNLYSISTRDWKRLKKQVCKCKRGTEWWSVIASILAGISGSALISCIAIPLEDSKSNFTRIVLFDIFLLCGILSLAFYKISSKINSIYNQSLEEINETISDIEKTINIPE